MERTLTLKLTNREIMYLIMAWDELRRTRAYLEHVSTATMTRLKLEGALQSETAGGERD